MFLCRTSSLSQTALPKKLVEPFTVKFIKEMSSISKGSTHNATCIRETVLQDRFPTLVIFVGS